MLTPHQHWLPQLPVRLWHHEGTVVAGRGARVLKPICNGCCLISPCASAGPGSDWRGRQACHNCGATSQHHDERRSCHALQTEGLKSNGIAGAHHQCIHILLLLSFHLCSSLLLHQVSFLLPCHQNMGRCVKKRDWIINSVLGV